MLNLKFDREHYDNEGVKKLFTNIDVPESIFYEAKANCLK